MAKDSDEYWNQWNLPPPEPFTVMTTLTPRVKAHIAELRQVLYQVINNLKLLSCLDNEAALLSRVLYRNYCELRRDKGFQYLKMVMKCLNKYLNMNLYDSVINIRTSLPHRFGVHSLEEDLPARSTIAWLLARIQAFAALFYRIFNLTTIGGRYLFQRLRLNWVAGRQLFVIALAARIRTIARFVVLRSVSWHSEIIPYIHTFSKVSGDRLKNYPPDLRKWLGGLKNMQAPKTVQSPLDMVLAMIDLTKPDEDDDDIIEVYRAFDGTVDENIKRLFEVVPVVDSEETEASPEPLVLMETMNLTESDNEDVGEVVECDGETSVVVSTVKNYCENRTPASSLTPSIIIDDIIDQSKSTHSETKRDQDCVIEEATSSRKRKKKQPAEVPEFSEVPPKKKKKNQSTSSKNDVICLTLDDDDSKMCEDDVVELVDEFSPGHSYNLSVIGGEFAMVFVEYSTLDIDHTNSIIKNDATMIKLMRAVKKLKNKNPNSVVVLSPAESELKIFWETNTGVEPIKIEKAVTLWSKNMKKLFTLLSKRNSHVIAVTVPLPLNATQEMVNMHSKLLKIIQENAKGENVHLINSQGILGNVTSLKDCNWNKQRVLKIQKKIKEIMRTFMTQA